VRFRVETVLAVTGLGGGSGATAVLVCDDWVIYYDPRNPQPVWKSHRCPRQIAPCQSRAPAAACACADAGLSKYNLGGDITPDDLPARNGRILVPGQVEKRCPLFLTARGDVGRIWRCSHLRTCSSS